MNSGVDSRSTVGREGGVVMIAMMMIIGPIIIMAFAFTTTMMGRNNLLTELVRQERAFMAAESGIDEAIYRASQATLIDGVKFERDLGRGMAFSVVPTHLLADGLDNDGDTLVDEGDEDVFEVLAAGTYRGTTRRLLAYVGPVPGPVLIDSALSSFNQTPQIQINFKGKGSITGNDTDMDGSPGPMPAIPGLAIQPPADVVDLIAGIVTLDNPGRLTGAGGTPSLGQSAVTMDINQVVADVKNTADIVLGDSYTSGDWGNGPNGDLHVIYREGNLKLDGYIQGAGIMVVTGKLEVYGGFRFDGILILLDNIQMDGSSRGGIELYGGLVQGPDFPQIEITDDVDISYSSEALALVRSLALGSINGLVGPPPGPFVLYNGWQEISRY